MSRLSDELDEKARQRHQDMQEAQGDLENQGSETPQFVVYTHSTIDGEAHVYGTGDQATANTQAKVIRTDSGNTVETEVIPLEAFQHPMPPEGVS